MLTYLFSHEILAKQFVDITTSYNIKVRLVEIEKGWQININDDLDKLVIVQLGDYYSGLLKQEHELSHPKKLKENKSMLTEAIQITLKSGETVVADIEQDILDKLLHVLSLDEINRLVNKIAGAMDDQEKDTTAKG